MVSLFGLVYGCASHNPLKVTVVKYKICRVEYCVIGNDFFNMNCVTLDVVSPGGYGGSKNTLGFDSYSNVLP